MCVCVFCVVETAEEEKVSYNKKLFDVQWVRVNLVNEQMAAAANSMDSIDYWNQQAHTRPRGHTHIGVERKEQRRKKKEKSFIIGLSREMVIIINWTILILLPPHTRSHSSISVVVSPLNPDECVAVKLVFIGSSAHITCVSLSVRFTSCVRWWPTALLCTASCFNLKAAAENVWRQLGEKFEIHVRILHFFLSPSCLASWQSFALLPCFFSLSLLSSSWKNWILIFHSHNLREEFSSLSLCSHTPCALWSNAAESNKFSTSCEDNWCEKIFQNDDDDERKKKSFKLFYCRVNLGSRAFRRVINQFIIVSCSIQVSIMQRSRQERHESKYLHFQQWNSTLIQSFDNCM